MRDVLAVTPVSLSFVVLGGFVVIFSMFSLAIKEKLFIGEVVLGTGFGVLIGPHCANIFNPRSWGSSSNEITLEFMRVVLATGLFAIGVELPKTSIKEFVKSLLIMVVPTMTFGWFICAGFIRLLFPKLSFISALVISACLTPTDPVLSSAIIGGKFAVKNVPGHIRRILVAESACNDGLAYPFLSISMYLTVEASTKVAFGDWFLIGWLYQVVLGTVLGAFIGWAFSILIKFSYRRGLIDRESFIAQFLALAIFTNGIANSLGCDDLLAAFAADDLRGAAISWDGYFNAHTENEAFSSVIDLVLNCACFVYIGAWLPFNQYENDLLGITPWKLVVLFVAFLALRRIPAMMLIYKWIPDVTNWREALFCGHFGPMGVGAIFISTLAIARLSNEGGDQSIQAELLSSVLHPIVSFIVLCSILTHGLSIPAFWFGRKAVLTAYPFNVHPVDALRAPESATDRVPRAIGGPDEPLAEFLDIESGGMSLNSRGMQAASMSPGNSSSKTSSQASTPVDAEAHKARSVRIEKAETNRTEKNARANVREFLGVDSSLFGGGIFVQASGCKGNPPIAEGGTSSEVAAPRGITPNEVNVKKEKS